MKKTLLLFCFLMAVATQAHCARKFTIFLHPDSSANVVCFLPEQSSGKAIVGVPGGGYSVLSNTHEGTMWADWLNQRGIAYFVVNYRLPNGNRTLPISDVLSNDPHTASLDLQTLLVSPLSNNISNQGIRHFYQNIF